MFTKSLAFGTTSGSGAVVVVVFGVVGVRAVAWEPLEPAQATNNSAASAPVVATTRRRARPFRIRLVILGIRRAAGNGSLEPVPVPRGDRLEGAGEGHVRRGIEPVAAHGLERTEMGRDVERSIVEPAHG